MSTTSLNFHNVTEASARVQSVNKTKWLTLEFRYSDGAPLEITLFSDSPEELLQAIARAAAPAHDELVAALQAIADMDASGQRADDLGRAAGVARAALTKAAPEQQEQSK